MLPQPPQRAQAAQKRVARLPATRYFMGVERVTKAALPRGHAIIENRFYTGRPDGRQVPAPQNGRGRRLERPHAPLDDSEAAHVSSCVSQIESRIAPRCLFPLDSLALEEFDTRSTQKDIIQLLAF